MSRALASRVCTTACANSNRFDYTPHMRTLIIITTILLLTVGCQLLDGEADTMADATVAPVQPTPVDGETEEVIPEATEPLAPINSQTTLTLWTIPELAPDPELPGGTLLLEQLNAFDQAYPEVELRVERKTVSEQGGSLSYLRTGRTVAPSVLPDVILLPSNHLAEAVTSGLVYPLEDYLSPEDVDDLYPVARMLAEVDGELFGYPFALNGLHHFVYNRAAITNTLPSAWQGLLEVSNGRLVFPAAGPAGAELTLRFYLEAGGTLHNESGQPALELEPLVLALQQIELGVAAGLVAPQSGSTVSMEQAWQLFQNETPTIIQTSAAAFLRRQPDTNVADYGFVPLAGFEGPLPPFVSAWMWIITTPDPAQQALAAELITSLVSAPSLGTYTLESRLIPGRRNALDSWPEDDLYVTFLRRQLAVARPLPAGVTNAHLLALSDATIDVILGLNTSRDAAEEAIAFLSTS